MISVILPTYNESEGIVRLLAGLNEALADHECEMLVVDDNSPDGTYFLVRDSGLANVKVILREYDPGLAASIRCGIENSVGDIIVIMDSDGNHHPKYIKFMVEALEFYGCVAGSRFLYGGYEGRKPLRHVLSYLFNIFLRFITNGQITDSLFGYVAIKRNVLEKLNFDEIFTGYGEYCIRLMFYLQKNSVPILQIPAVRTPRLGGRGNERFLGVFLKYTMTTLDLIRKHGRLKPGWFGWRKIN